MKTLWRCALTAFAAGLLSGCTTGDLSRGIYEGARARNESFRATPLEKSRDRLPGYDDYDKERRSSSTGRNP